MPDPIADVQQSPSPVVTQWPLRVMAAAEGVLASALLLAMVALTLADLAARALFGSGLPSGDEAVRLLSLWVILLGAAVAAREDRHLSMKTLWWVPSRLRRGARLVAFAAAAGITALLARGGLDLVRTELAYPGPPIVGFPAWVAELIMPLGFALIAVRLVGSASERWAGRVAATIGLGAGLVLGQAPAMAQGLPRSGILVSMTVLAGLGMPMFAVIGGTASLLFLARGTPLDALSADTFSLATTPVLPAIPLFMLAGFLLARGGSWDRLHRCVRAWTRLPGGPTLSLLLVSAGFTALTGASGLTLLTLGGLALTPTLLRRDPPGHPDVAILGVASPGLLLPPAAPILLYGIAADVAVSDLLLAALVPGLLLVGLTGAWVLRSDRRAAPRATGRDRRELVAALRAAAWELAVPLVAWAGLFSGLLTVVEAAALTVAYVFLIQLGVRRDVSPRKQVVPAVIDAIAFTGSVLVLLALATGLTDYLLDAGVPALVLDWLQKHAVTPVGFLLATNVLLLVLGCLTDVFSATVLLAPLLVPVGLAYAIDPIQLGVLFVATLGLGSLVPPTGPTLLQVVHELDRPLGQAVRGSLPVITVHAVVVALIAFVPWLTVGVVAGLQR